MSSYKVCGDRLQIEKKVENSWSKKECSSSNIYNHERKR